MPNFVVEYSIPYEHIVQVGVIAHNADHAVMIATNAFDGGTIWDDEDLPLLSDTYEEQGGRALSFTAVQVENFPRPDVSIEIDRRHRHSLQMLELLNELSSLDPGQLMAVSALQQRVDALLQELKLTTGNG